MSQKRLCFGSQFEFVRTNCDDCEIKKNKGCRHQDPMTCQRAVNLVRMQNNNGYQVVVGKFIVTPIEEGGVS